MVIKYEVTGNAVESICAVFYNFVRINFWQIIVTVGIGSS